VDVNLVELYVVVSGADGRPVKGLAVDDFRIRENGAPQRLAAVSDAGDLPVTVGLAIDSSASMFVKLAAVQEAASRFLAGLAPGRDHAFLVDFNDRPRLAEEPTRDLDRVSAAVARLQPGGHTSLWESIVYSLVQLQGVRGRKALVVYSDGADEDEGFSYRTCLRFARKVGVPIYVVVSNNEAVRTDWLGIRSLGDRVERLTSAVGGRAYLVRTGDDLTEIYREIEAELRSQYLLTFYSQRPPAAQEWRDVEVDVQRPGLRARTVSGHQL
jgi:Ca-activated chloride channel family protein